MTQAPQMFSAVLSDALLKEIKGHQADIAVLKQLLADGADPNVRDRIGNTALMLAACACNYYAIELLIAAGADLNAQTPDGWSALAFLEHSADTSMENWLCTDTLRNAIAAQNALRLQQAEAQKDIHDSCEKGLPLTRMLHLRQPPSLKRPAP